MNRDAWESFVRRYLPSSARRRILESIAAQGPIAPVHALAIAGVSLRDRARGLGFVSACVGHGYLHREPDGVGIVAAHLAPRTLFEEIVCGAFAAREAQ